MSPRTKNPKAQTVRTRGGRRIPVADLRGLVQKANSEERSVLSFVAAHCHLAIEDAAHVLREAGLR